MASKIGKLSPLTVSREKRKGLYPDGGNLYLQVSGNGAKSWIFRYMTNGKSRDMGLGAVNAVKLADARVKALDCRSLLAAGIDPIDARKSDDAKKRLAAARSRTFEQCAEDYIEAHRKSWRN